MPEWIRAEFSKYSTTLQMEEGHGGALGFYGITPMDTWERLIAQHGRNRTEVRAVQVEDGFDLWSVHESATDENWTTFLKIYYGDEEDAPRRTVIRVGWGRKWGDER